MYKKTRAEGFGDEVQRRIMIGAYVLSHGYYDAYYLQAQKIRRMIADDFQNAFKDCDVIVLPRGPHRGLEAGRARQRPAGHYLADIFTLLRIVGWFARHERVPAGFGERHARGPAADWQLLPGWGGCWAAHQPAAGHRFPPGSPAPEFIAHCAFGV